MEDYIRKSLDIQANLDRLLECRENHAVEFKSAKGSFPGSFWDTYSSFANTSGGMIVFGVKEKHGIFSLDPLSDDAVVTLKKKFFDLEHDREKVSQPLLTDKDVVTSKCEGGNILAFHIPRASRQQRPVYIGLDPMTGTYRRDSEGDYLCDPSVVAQMFAERESSQVKTEARILANYSWDDIDMESFRQYKNIFANLNPSHPWVGLDDEQLLTRLGGYRKDRRTGQTGFTLAGILMFGKSESITDVECLPGFMVDYREIPDDNSAVRWSDRLYPDGTWEANLFQFYRKALLKLYAFLPKPFKLIGDERQEETPAHEAVREGLINMCIHASYAHSPHLIVEKRKNTIVLSNPGTLLISQSQYYEGGHTECRNPSLQKMFGLIGRSDKAGSGVDKILKGWKYAKWRRPHINERSRPDMVELYMPLESLFSDEVLQRLKDIYGDSITTIPHAPLSILALAITEPKISNASLQGFLDQHPSDITKLLRNMCTERLLVPSGFGRGTIYHINENYRYERGTATSDSTSSDSTSSDSTSSNSTSSNSTRFPREMILNCCRNQWQSSKTIARLIGRDPSYTRRIIKRLVADGLLVTEYPEPTHPAQRYRATISQH